MARKQFDIKYRPQIESGEYKVETRDGRKARIVHWDLNCTSPIVAVMDAHIDLPGEIVDVFSVSGRAFDDLESPSDLFIVTPEPEMTAFEKKVYAYCDGKTVGEELIKRIAKELLDYARKELEPEVLERLEVAYKNQDEVVYENGKRDGKVEALKNLPRWKTIKKDDTTARIPHVGTNIVGEKMLYIGENAISIRRLTKLPGFKED